MVSYDVFKAIMKIHNKAVVKAMIEEGFTYKFPNKMGAFRIVNKPVKPKIKGSSIQWPIDWPASYKLKERLEAEGVPLYNKEDNPTGKKWLIRKVAGIESWFQWYKAGFRDVNQHFFKFYPSIGEFGITRILKKKTKADPKIREKYQSL